jgi:uncharacterized membrane protein YhaH (DUF805 family)
MNFFDAVKVCFAKYVDFSGRALRSEYWYFVLFVLLAELCLNIINRRLGIAFNLAIILPHLAVGARRLHDTDRSAWWLLLSLIPIIGWVVLIIWYCQPGEDRLNRFGDAPFPGV